MMEEYAIINQRITSLRRVYFLLALVSIISFILIVSFGFFNSVDINNAMNAFFSVVLFFSINYGLKHKRKWTPPLILIFSTFYLIGFLTSHHYPVVDFYENLMLIGDAFVGFVLALFCTYQIYFFSRNYVRKFFGAKGKII